MNDKITISSGATSVELTAIDRLTIYPNDPKNFTIQTLADNSKVFDVEPIRKKRWNIKYDVPLTAQQKTDIETLFDVSDSITLVEDFIESAVSYTVFFEDRDPSYETIQGDTHYNFVFQEV